MRRTAFVLAGLFVLAAFAADAQAPNGTLITCESLNNVRHTCRIDVANGVTINRQFSKDDCVRGKTWGTTRNNDGVWVDDGCRAEFLVGNGNAQLQNGSPHTLTCESIPGHTKRCAAVTSYGVQLSRQLSKRSCVLNRDWGYDGNGVWVKDGCRAEFTIGNPSMASASSVGSIVTCESPNGMNHRCAANTNSGVTLSRQFSDNACVRGKSWGYDADGIWVSDGCRAEFRLGNP
jgi:hypothetical protein